MTFVARTRLRDGLGDLDAAARRGPCSRARHRAGARVRLRWRRRAPAPRRPPRNRRRQRQPDARSRRPVALREEHPATPAHGSLTSTRVPDPGVDSIVRSPPSSRTRAVHAAQAEPARLRCGVDVEALAVIGHDEAHLGILAELDLDGRGPSVPDIALMIASRSTRRSTTWVRAGTATVSSSVHLHLPALASSGLDRGDPEGAHQRLAAGALERSDHVAGLVERAGAATTMCRITVGASGSSGEPPPLLKDEREVLSDTVVDVPGDALALVEHGRGRQQTLRPPQLQRTADEQGEEEPEPQHVAGVEVWGVQRREQEVVQPGERPSTDAIASQRDSSSPVRRARRANPAAATPNSSMTTSCAPSTVGLPTTRACRPSGERSGGIASGSASAASGHGQREGAQGECTRAQEPPGVACRMVRGCGSARPPRAP